MPNLKHLPIGDKAPEMINAIVEIPKGSRTKIEYDPDLGIFKLDRVLYSAVHYPAAYGFIPGTHGGDGDPLDVLILTDEELATGLLLDVIPIGALHIVDDKGEDIKIMCVAAFDPNVCTLKDIDELPKHKKLEIEQFFSTYKALEKKDVFVGDWMTAQQARDVITQSMQ